MFKEKPNGQCAQWRQDKVMEPEIPNFDITDEAPESFIEHLNRLIELIEERAKQPPVEMEPVFLFYGTLEQFESMSEIEVLMRSSFLGYR